MKNFYDKLKQAFIGASPIFVIILAVHFLISPLPTSSFINFLISMVVLVIGQAFFMVGVDQSILIMGNLVGNNVRKLKKLWVILLFGFLFGTMATVAEPAVSVLAGNVSKINPSIDVTLLTWIVSAGIGILVAFGLFRIFAQISLKWSLLITSMLAIIFVLICPAEFQAVAFDFSAATTGVITVPFILALGVGVSAVLGYKSQDNNYGLIGLASLGPIITMAVMGIIFGGGSGGEFPVHATPDFITIIIQSLTNILIALLPIVAAFAIFNFAFIKLPRKKIYQIIIGVLITIFGLTLFLSAVNFGFSNAGRHIGEAFTDPEKAGWFKYLLIPFGLILGFAITYSELGIRVFAIQIEQNTEGQIKRRTTLLVLAVGLAIAIMLGMIRILFEINILYFLIPVFFIGLGCIPFISKMFAGIAADSGGVASGTISAAFFVPLSIGASQTLGLEPMLFAFGMIAFIRMLPLVSVSILGLIQAHKLRKIEAQAASLPKTDIKQNAYNYIIGIITNPSTEERISNYLANLNAIVMETFQARGSSSSILTMEEKQTTFMMAMISKQSAEKMLDILDTEFEYIKHNTGIAFTIPIESIGK